MPVQTLLLECAGCTWHEAVVRETMTREGRYLNSTPAFIGMKSMPLALMEGWRSSSATTSSIPGGIDAWCQ